MRKFDSVNDVLDFAIAREVEAYDFYSNLASRVNNPKIRKVLEEFAIDELQHRLKLEAVKAEKYRMKPEEIGSLDIPDIAEPVTPAADMDYIKAVGFAMEKEKESFRLYSDLARKVRQKKLTEMFSLLAQEEAKHKLHFEIEYDLAQF
jgi:rubrerythrin